MNYISPCTDMVKNNIIMICFCILYGTNNLTLLTLKQKLPQTKFAIWFCFDFVKCFNNLILELLASSVSDECCKMTCIRRSITTFVRHQMILQLINYVFLFCTRLFTSYLLRTILPMMIDYSFSNSYLAV